MPDSWDMPRRSNVCHVGGREFEVDEPICALLFETRDGYERRDYCREHAPGEDCGAIARWVTHRPVPRTQKAVAFDRDATFSFFRRLPDADAQDVDDATPQKLQFRFVLALLLWRKKVLRFESSTTEAGRETWHFRAPHTDDEFHVARPDLDEDQMEALSRQLETLLSDPPAELSANLAESDRQEDPGE